MNRLYGATSDAHGTMPRQDTGINGDSEDCEASLTLDFRSQPGGV